MPELMSKDQTATRLDPEIRGLGRATRKILFEIATRLVALNRERGFARLGFSSLADYAHERLGFSPRKTRDLVELATRSEKLPLIRGELEHGTTHYTKLRTVAAAATPENEAEWLERAAKSTSRELEEAVAGALGKTPPRIKVVLELSSEQYADLEDAVRALRRERRDDMPTLSREEALVELVRRGIGSVSGSPRPRFQTVIYRCDACGKAERETRLGAVPVDPATAACAECDSTVVDGKKPGRVASKIPPAIRRFILNRDRRRCKVPGCSNRDYLDVHHLVPLADGGTHDPELLACLCDRHHGLIHSGEIRAEGAPGALRFFTREGNEIAARDRAHVRTVELPESARAVLRALGEEWAHPDDLIERAGLPVPDTLGALTVLEIEGLVRRSGGQFSLCGV